MKPKRSAKPKPRIPQRPTAAQVREILRRTLGAKVEIVSVHKQLRELQDSLGHDTRGERNEAERLLNQVLYNLQISYERLRDAACPLTCATKEFLAIYDGEVAKF